MAQKRKKATTPAPAKGDQPREGERLQKVLAAAGVASRRSCEEYIISGRVVVDGETVTELGTRVDPQTQEISVDGVRLRKPRLVYYAVNKPVGIVSTNADPSGRPRVIDLVPGQGQRLFTVGRLDKSSEGLILVTNDGELAQRLTHPQYEVEKTYDVVVAGNLSPAQAKEVEKGVHLSDGLAQVAGLKVKNRGPKSTRLQMVLREGRNREIRRVLARVGHKVLQLRRVRIGDLTLGDLQPSEFRQLSSTEISLLRRSVGRAATSSKSNTPRGRNASSRKTSKPSGNRSPMGKGTGAGTRKKKPATGRKPETTEGSRAESGTGTKRKPKPTGPVRKKKLAGAGGKSTSSGGVRKKAATAKGRKPKPTGAGRKKKTFQKTNKRVSKSKAKRR